MQRPVPDLPAGPRYALILATTTYADADLTPLRAPAQDSADMAEILGDPEIGGFAVTTVLDRPQHEIRQELGEFLTDRKPRDTILLYLSGHGVQNRAGELFFATRDTRLNRLSYTAIEATWLLKCLAECRARQQVVILDCCYSGSFPGAKGPELDLERRLIGAGRGFDLLTASRASELSYEEVREGKRRLVRSVFTAALADGIRSGAADANNDGLITVEDAYHHAYDMLKAAGAAQNPQYTRRRGEGKIFLARNPRGMLPSPGRLSADLRSALGSGHPEIRLGAVRALGGLLKSMNQDEALVARARLREIAAEDDDATVAEAAEGLLDTPAPGDLITDYPGVRPGPAGVVHGVGITVLVGDLTRSIVFYRDGLGFYEIEIGTDSAVLASGDTRLVLRQVRDQRSEAGRLIYLNLEVGDIDEMYAELRAKGIKFVHSPRPVNRGDRLELWSATFRDPDGHSIAITQWRAVRMQTS